MPVAGEETFEKFGKGKTIAEGVEICTRLDAAIQQTDFSKQSNRVCGIPLYNFRSGVSSLPKIKSQEYAGALLALMVVLGMNDKYLPTAQTLRVQCALSGLYLLWFFLKRTYIPREELGKLPGLVNRSESVLLRSL